MRFPNFPKLLTSAGLLVALALSAPAAAETRLEGQFDTGAYWQMRVPDGWTPGDGLVVWNHGFDLDAPGPAPDTGPLDDLQLQQGYAVAATSYRQNGWALFETIGDVRDLVAEFGRRFDAPERIYLAGGSLGGLVSVQAAEAAALDNVAGVYSVCGALGGSRLWDAALDLRLAYDTVCGDVSGASLPGGAEGLPQRLDPEDYANEDVTTVLAGLLGQQVNRCTGVLDPASERSAAQQQRLDRLMALLDIPNEQFFLVNMGYATFGLADLVHDPGKLDGRTGSGNAAVVYGDAELDASIEREDVPEIDRQRLLTNYLPTGELGDARMVALHTSRDGLVPVENLSDYAARAPSDRLSTALVTEAEPTHCGFSAAEVTAGWQALVDWVENDGPQPDAGMLQSRCQSLAGDGFPGPCRIASAVEVPPLDTVVRPRNRPGFEVGAGITGAWFDPGRNGEGWALEILPGGDAVAYWFTYPPAGAPGTQQWFIGTGRADGNRVTLEVLSPSGPPFGENDVPVNLADWGELQFHFAGCDSALVRWVGPTPFGVEQLAVQRLSRPVTCDEPPAGDKSSPLPPIAGAITGSWYDPSFDGSGLHVEQLNDGNALFYWFTFDGQGRPAWILGTGQLQGGSFRVTDAVLPRGARFGDDFDPGDVSLVPFGAVDLGFESCDEAGLDFESERPAFGSGARALRRLSVPAGADCPVD